MCGVAGIVDLRGGRQVPGGAVRTMAEAIIHRGPDEDGYFERPGLSFASRRLSIVGLADGRQPISNEDRSVSVVFNGELFDYPERKADLESRGHRFATHCDTELVPHLYEEHQAGTFERLRGQFAVALWDQRRQRLHLARDRFGICPLYWTRQTTAEGDWLLFGSEIKAILASGMVRAEPDLRGINNVFTYFALPGPTTCFKGIQLLLPGHYLTVQLGRPGDPVEIRDTCYYEIDFPDQGDEDPGLDQEKLVDEFERVLMGATERRLRADVPVVSYLSGGIDSSIVVALACKARGKPIPTFTIQIDEPSLDETNEATVVARHVGTEPVIVKVGSAEVLGNYARLIQAAEGPVIDTSCAALLLLAQEVNARGYKVALTGEGSDEWMAGYSWFKIHRVLNALNSVPGLRLGSWGRKGYLRFCGAARGTLDFLGKQEAACGGPNAWLELYGMISLAKMRFYSPRMAEATCDHVPYADLQPNLDRVRRWHPLNRSLYWGARVHLGGMLLTLKGDRVAMNSSVETRYPFLDEEVFAFLAKIHPRWKLHGFKDKYLLRLLGERWLPHSIAWRKKAMFRAPFDSFFSHGVPPYVDQLLSEESLRKTDYFDPAAVRQWIKAFQAMPPKSYRRLTLEMGLVGVVATQLWHHTFIEACLADLPSLAQPALLLDRAAS